MDGPGVYVHVPFCRHRCDYCDFAVQTGADDRAMSGYVAALRAELERLAAAGPAAVAPPGAAAGREWPTFGSVFVGGGTPTQLPAAALGGVLEHVRDVLPVDARAEVTVEANPEDVDASSLAPLVDAGLTRLSIGGQSFAPHVLDFLTRRHGAGASRRAVASARAAGVPTVNLDLIYGAPGETPADWAATLDEAVATGVDHVSAYALTLEANTPYAADVRRGTKPAPDDDVAADRMAEAEARLAAAGLARYEISNWARRGAECRHNLVYWRGGDWLGVGASAHGHWQGRRWWNVRPTGRYVSAVLGGRPARAGEETLTPSQRRAERLMLGLRLAEGVDLDEVAPVDEGAAAALVDAGLLRDEPERLVLTPAGRPLADRVVVSLLPSEGPDR